MSAAVLDLDKIRFRPPPTRGPDRARLLVPADDPLKYIVGQLGTKAGPRVTERRGWMAVDWSIRVSLVDRMIALRDAAA